MDETGFAAITALCMTAAAAAVAAATLTIGRFDLSASRDRVAETHAIYLSSAAAIVAHAGGLSRQVIEFETASGHCRAERTFSNGGRSAALHIWMTGGKRVEIGWDLVGDDWRVSYWREP